MSLGLGDDWEELALPRCDESAGCRLMLLDTCPVALTSSAVNAARIADSAALPGLSRKFRFLPMLQVLGPHIENHWSLSYSALLLEFGRSKEITSLFRSLSPL